MQKERANGMDAANTRGFPPYIERMSSFNDKLIAFEKLVLTICTIVLVIAIFIEVVCRYIFLISTPWAEELSRYLFVWMTYLAGGYALHTGGQIEIDIAPTLIRSIKAWSTEQKERMILILKSVGLLITVIFLLAFCWVFGNYILFISQGSQTSQTMHIPMWIVYMPVLIGSVITIWHGIFRFFGNVYDLKGMKGKEA